VLTYVSGNSRWEAATVADQSATNELQTIDTFSLSGQTLRASLSNDNQAAKTVTLPVVGITAGTNVTVSSTGGNFTINSSGGGGTPAGSTGEVQFSNAGAFGASSNLFWNNAAAPAGQRLGVGNSSPGARVQIDGLGLTSSTSSLLVRNGSQDAFQVRDDRVIRMYGPYMAFGDVNTGFGTTTTGSTFSATASDLLFIGGSLGPTNACGFFNVWGFQKRNTSGLSGGFLLTNGTFNPTSGSGQFAMFGVLSSTVSINQTGTATGITRGLFLDPTITSAFDYRGIETTNSSGYQLYLSGTAPSYLNGKLSVGTTTANASSIVDITSTTQGVLLPRMTTTARGNITSPADGLTIYNTTSKTQDVYNNTRWLTGNAGLTGSATLDFGSTAAQTSSDLTITVTGAADGDVVSLGVPNASVNANTNYTAWVSAANTVTVRFNNYSSAAVDPASGTFKVFVTKFS
jgi:hypothetical protein